MASNKRIPKREPLTRSSNTLIPTNFQFFAISEKSGQSQLFSLPQLRRMCLAAGALTVTAIAFIIELCASRVRYIISKTCRKYESPTFLAAWQIVLIDQSFRPERLDIWLACAFSFLGIQTGTISVFKPDTRSYTDLARFCRFIFPFATLIILQIFALPVYRPILYSETICRTT